LSVQAARIPMLSSPHNPRLNRVRALLEKRKAREEEQAFVVEGVRLVEEALASGWPAELVLYSSQITERGQAVVQGFQQQGVETLEIAPKLMGSLSGIETAPGLLAVLPLRQLPLPDPLNFLLISDNLRDPGNLGTLLRTAAASGVQAALLSPGTTDAFAPKVLRAGMGAHFRLPVLHLNWEEIRAACKEQAAAKGAPLRIFLAEAAEGTACWNLDLRQPLALMVGSEAEGASREALALADELITIPMPGNSESLNAAIAASILLFEIVRQRRTL
jgi:RNA methyltransferase, TrmH family